MAALSLLLSMNVPGIPRPGHEVLLGRRLSGPAPAGAAE
jgi:hypothetical protein